MKYNRCIVVQSEDKVMNYHKAFQEEADLNEVRHTYVKASKKRLSLMMLLLVSLQDILRLDY